MLVRGEEEIRGGQGHSPQENGDTVPQENRDTVPQENGDTFSERDRDTVPYENGDTGTGVVRYHSPAWLRTAAISLTSHVTANM